MGILCGASGAYVDVPQPDVSREAVSVRPFSGGLYSSLPSFAIGSAAKCIQKPFMNGSAWDMTVNGSTTQQVFSISAGTASLIVSGVGLEMITSNNIVFNGSSFGGLYYFAGGLLGLGAGFFPPAALAKGLLLSVTSGGLNSPISNLTINEDFMAAQDAAAGGSLTGTTDTIRSKYQIKQPIMLNSGDSLSWTVRDNMTNNQGIVSLRSYAYGQILN